MKPFKLDEHRKSETGFTIPDGYFEDFSKKLATELNLEPKVIAINQSKKLWYSAVAAVLVIGLGLTASNIFKTTIINTPDATAIESYLSDQRSTEDNIAELLASEDFTPLEDNANLDDAAVEELLTANPNLEQYIID